jgi:hypothetical protein
VGLADAHNAVGRLWEPCFYERIAYLRGYLAQEQKRRKGGAGDVAAWADAWAGEYARQLGQFLGEAVALRRCAQGRSLGSRRRLEGHGRKTRAQAFRVEGGGAARDTVGYDRDMLAFAFQAPRLEGELLRTLL